MSSPELKDLLSLREYDWAAEYHAKFGALPNNLSMRCFNLIQADTEAFQKRVREFSYALAMGKTS